MQRAAIYSDPVISVGDALHADAEVTSGQEQGSDDRRLNRLAWTALAIALLPIVVAAVRAVRDGWVPVGDAAVMAVRTRDVFGGELPRLGMWASTSRELGIDFNHPGPMLYLVMAVPAAIFGGPGGIVAGTALVHVTSVLGIFAVARRRGGPLLAIASMTVLAALCWSMGSAVLVEPWHATTVLLPFLLFLLLGWSVACGDLVCLPIAVVVGSLVVQTSLSFAVFVAAVLIVATVTGIFQRRASSRWWWPALLAVAAASLCWVLPLAEQISGPSGDGNISRLLESRELEQTTLDAAESARTTAAVLALPPGWSRPSWAETIEFGPFGNPLPSLGVAMIGLVALAALLAFGAWLAWRRRDRDALIAVIGAAGLGVLALVTAGQTPTSLFGTVAYQLRWLWPLGAFITFALIAACLGRPTGRARHRVAGALVACTALLATANLPASDQGTTAPAATQPVARLVAGAVDDADLESTLLVTCAEHIFDPYCETTLDALQRREVDFVVPWESTCGSSARRAAGMERTPPPARRHHRRLRRVPTPRP